MNNTNELQNVIALGLPRGDNRVIAAGPITLQPHSRPYRIVMVNWGNNFSVHTEFFEVDTDEIKAGNVGLLDACENASTYLENGNYFKPTDFEKAVRLFSDKLNNHLQFLESIYRVLTPA